MALLDAFNSNMFSTVSLSTAVNKLPFKPGRIGAMNLFENKGIRTTTVVIEERQGRLALLTSTRRGSTVSQSYDKARRTARSFVIPHYNYDDEILADDIQGVRAFGSETELEVLSQVVNDTLGEMRAQHDVTHEFLRAGAVQGLIKDGDGSTLFNLFTEFGVSETVRSFELEVATTDVRGLCLATIRDIEDALGAAPYTQVHGFCGDTFFDEFISHADVQDAYSRFKDGEMLRNDPRAAFPFGGILFENYRAKVGSTDYIPLTECRFFPTGTPGLFKEHFAPADFIETVNTVGKPVYAKQARIKFDKGIEVHTQSNPLPLCTRPLVLVKGTNT